MAKSTLNIVSLTHDIAQKKSYVGFVWADEPAKRLGLEVPYGLPLDQVEQAARDAVDGLSSELSDCAIATP